MQPLAAAALMIVTTLGGVSVNISGSESGTGITPKQPTEEAMEYVWPTRLVYPNQRIVMSNDAVWIVKSSRTNAAGVITIEVRPSSSTSRNIKVEVGPADVDTPIWWSTAVYYIPPPNTDPIEPAPEDPQGP